MNNILSNSEPLWQPAAEQVESANMTSFMRYVEQEWEICLTDYASLYQWSINFPEHFWSSIWTFCDIRHSRKWNQVVTNYDRMPGAKWFTGAKLNFAENLMRYRDDHEAIVFWNEQGPQETLSYAELYQRVSRTAQALKDTGIEPGNCVAGLLPNMPEAIIAMLAATSLGAIWSSTSPDFGKQGVLDRFGQIEPKVLFTVDGYHYNGKPIDISERVADIVEHLPSLEKVVVKQYFNPDSDISRINKAVTFEDFSNTATSEDIHFEQFSFDHPLYILYSSGTTGIPKCIVHGAGGTLIQHLKELTLHSNLTREDRIFYATTCGWMMWNWLVSSLAVGATVLLYDGSPSYPDNEILLDMAEREKMTIFGTSARFLAMIEKEGLSPGQSHDLSSLHTILSTGSPLAAESFDYVYGYIKEDVRLSSISGGTDIVSCFALGNPIGPVYRGELQARGLGMKVEVFNDQGQSVIGEKGELVCTAPFPSMPIYFGNDPERIKYHDAYFDLFPNVWHHGDFVLLTEHDGLIIYGRSDAVLNPGGVRIGTAEIYRQVEQIPEVLESVIIAQEWREDVRLILFVKLRPNTLWNEALMTTIKTQIRENTTPRHVPRKIIPVADIPRTLSGKIVELAVREIVHHRPVKNRDALANPESLALFENIAELQHE